MKPASLRAQLLVGILVPVLMLLVFNAVGLYRQALNVADTAYDRTLLASAKAIGELLEVDGPPGRPQLRGNLTYAALEAFEADNRSRIAYRVTGFAGEMVSGFEDLRLWRGRLPVNNTYAALVDFYDDSFRGEPVRVAVLLQPVAGTAGQGMATIQVAETLELRHTLARELLLDTLWRQLALLGVIVAVVLFVVHRATRPVLRLSAEMRQRGESDLGPLPAAGAPRELLPLLDATNAVMARLQHLLDHQQRFVRDVSHQLRTPLAVLKAQVQSARRGDVPQEQALQEIAHTVDGATELANQMLALAKIEQLRQQGEPGVIDWEPVVRAVALDLAPLIAQAQLEFELQASATPVRAHEWALRELTRNLLHNAIKYSPHGAALSVQLGAAGGQAELRLLDAGPGIPAELARRLFEPFSRGSSAQPGAGLGLNICREIVQTLKGQIRLDNRPAPSQGLDARVVLPMPTPA